MVIYGTRPVAIGEESGGVCACPSCADRNNMSFIFHRSHFHVFWIPMFPLKLKGVAVCSACETVFEPKEMSSSLKLDFDNAKLKLKKPIWQFTGLGLIAILILMAQYSSYQNERDEQVYLAAPEVNDVYYCTSSERLYSTMRVDSVSSDSVFVCPNMYEIDKKSKVYRIDKVINYPAFKYGISKSTITEMYNRDEIFKIERN